MLDKPLGLAAAPVEVTVALGDGGLVAKARGGARARARSEG